MTDQITRASKMAGEWWAKRLNPAHAAKREAFAAAVAKNCEAELRRNSKYEPYTFLEVDYDPSEGAMLDAVREVIDPNCRGFGFSAQGILPLKHSLAVTPTKLSPKEGYGNFLGDIAVPTS